MNNILEINYALYKDGLRIVYPRPASFQIQKGGCMTRIYIIVQQTPLMSLYCSPSVYAASSDIIEKCLLLFAIPDFP